MGTVLVIFSFSEWIMPLPTPMDPQFVKLLISNIEKKKKKHYVEYDFSMGTVFAVSHFSEWIMI